MDKQTGVRKWFYENVTPQGREQIKNHFDF